MENIKVGELVMVVKPTRCCKSDDRISSIGVVERVYDGKTECKHCGEIHDKESIAKVGEYGFFLDRLKKIPPLSELDKIETKEELPCKV